MEKEFSRDRKMNPSKPNLSGDGGSPVNLHFQSCTLHRLSHIEVLPMEVSLKYMYATGKTDQVEPNQNSFNPSRVKIKKHITRHEPNKPTARRVD